MSTMTGRQRVSFIGTVIPSFAAAGITIAQDWIVGLPDYDAAAWSDAWDSVAVGDWCS
jgi:hypothetical protein